MLQTHTIMESWLLADCSPEKIVKQSSFMKCEEIHREWTAAGVRAITRTITHTRLQVNFAFHCEIKVRGKNGDVESASC